MILVDRSQLGGVSRAGTSLLVRGGCQPLWSRAEGEHRLEALPDGKTRVHFMERYHVVNPVMRALLERRVHHFISKDNDRMVREGIEQALAAARRRAPASG